MIVVLIPAYEPDEKLVNLVNQLNLENFPILVVDDGSGEKYRGIFDKISPVAKVIHSPRNEGKGCALRRGMAALKELYPGCTDFICCDADGQHKLADIIKVRDNLRDGASFVLTTRDLKGAPLRSAFGNWLSRFVFTLITGIYMRDNQSGLRGFKTEHIDWLLKVKGDKYDYEINEIYYACKMGVEVLQVPIETVYIDNNSSSHFNSGKDTALIYKRLFTSSVWTLISAVLYEIAMILVQIYMGYDLCIVTVMGTGVVTCVIAALIDLFVYGPVNHIRRRVLLFAMIRRMIYALVCFAASYLCPFLPILLVFDMTVLVGFAVRYFIHKR